jgi:hypothetical protein
MRTFCAMCACVLLVTRAAAAGQPLVADFDGDGQHDTATLDAHERSSVIRVWLSTTRAISLIRSRTPIAAIGAQDIDGDRQAELIAGGTSHLQVWTMRQRRFERVRPRRSGSRIFTHPEHHHVEDGPNDVHVAVSCSTASAFSLTLAPLPRGPGLQTSRVDSRVAARAASLQFLEPFAPRPPPLSI